MRRLEFVLHQSRPNFTSFNQRNSSICAWQEHEQTHTRTHQGASRECHAIDYALSISKRTSPATQHSFRQCCASRPAPEEGRKGGAPRSPSTIHPQHRLLIRSVAVQAVCLCRAHASAADAAVTRARRGLIRIRICCWCCCCRCWWWCMDHSRLLCSTLRGALHKAV